MDLWDYIVLTAEIFFFVAYLFILFYVITDLFRDHELSGWWKAVWIFFLIVIPLLSALVYLLARGGGMAKRQQAAALEAKKATDQYIRTVSNSSPAEQIGKAKELLDAGTIDQAEYDQLKAAALR